MGPAQRFLRRASRAQVAWRARCSGRDVARPRSPGFAEAQQAKYTSDDELIEASPELARALGLDGDAVSFPEPQFERPKRERRWVERGDMSSMGVAATAESLDALLREGRAEFRNETSVWTPHRPPRPEKSEGGQRLVIKSEFEPKGDQPTAIAELVEGVKRHDRTQVLLGVTGSGKTFTMAKVIEATQRPALILAPNKTLAAQLYGEFKSFFPDNAVEYFVSYYDYYQPEAYVPRTDTYIEKESSINEQIDRMRHSATRALLERDDVIIVASVSCIYGIGSVETYSAMTFTLKKGERIDQRQLHRRSGRAAIQAHAAAISSAARSACAATRSTFSRRTMRTAPGA